MSFAYSAFCHSWPFSCSLSLHLSCTGHLDVQDNDLSGLLPTELGLMTNLTYMDFGKNRFSSGIPTEIGNVTGLIHFDVRSNKLIGLLPTELGLLTRLKYFSTAGNSFYGTLPREMGNLKKLTALDFPFLWDVYHRRSYQLWKNISDRKSVV